MVEAYILTVWRRDSLVATETRLALPRPVEPAAFENSFYRCLKVTMRMHRKLLYIQLKRQVHESVNRLAVQP